MKQIFEEFKAGRKTYLVFYATSLNFYIMYAARKRFHCTEEHLEVATGYVVKDELYFDNPHKKSQKRVLVIHYQR